MLLPAEVCGVATGAWLFMVTPRFAVFPCSKSESVGVTEIVFEPPADHPHLNVPEVRVLLASERVPPLPQLTTTVMSSSPGSDRE